jgi:tRNA nucleotidyltransferase/poly(A) polymerase
MSDGLSIAGAPFLADPHLQKLLAALSTDGDEARVAGGAVRNALFGQEVADVDIATTTLPDDTTGRAEAAGFRTVPTGIEHGTVTVIAGGRPFEVTTLRADIETDGRRARVVFGRDWKRDAERRDFTINGLYARADGSVVDLVGGAADIESRTVRFIGEPDERIREDYLRILRFFRFFAWYGSGRPDGDALRACARLKDGLDRLSVERVWDELKKLLAAPDPARALLWMRQAGVLSRVLPETEKWGIDAIHPLTECEAALGWAPDALLRLEAVVPPVRSRMGELAARLKLSKAEAARLGAWADAAAPEPESSETALARRLYEGDPAAIIDRLKLALANARRHGIQDDAALIDAAGYARQLSFVEKWRRPVFPIKGQDLSGLGFSPGPAMGEVLRDLEREWVESGFRLGRDALLERAAARK